MALTAEQLIQQYNLQPHPEGGYYRETYRSNEEMDQSALPARFSGKRNFSTAIYFLLQQADFSAFHRIKADECWHFYAGSTLHIYVLDSSGILSVIHLGNNIQAGERFQYVVPAGCWFASAPAADSQFSFVGCTVAPGFDFADFEMAEAAILSKEFPQHHDLFRRLCR